MKRNYDPKSSVMKNCRVEFIGGNNHTTCDIHVRLPPLLIKKTICNHWNFRRTILHRMFICIRCIDEICNQMYTNSTERICLIFYDFVQRARSADAAAGSGHKIRFRHDRVSSADEIADFVLDANPPSNGLGAMST